MGLLATYTSGRLGLTSALDPAVVVWPEPTASADCPIRRPLSSSWQKKKRKITIYDLKCYPRTAILDATLLKNLSAKMVAHAGIDALNHAVEACLTDAATTEVTTALAHAAMQLEGWSF